MNEDLKQLQEAMKCDSIDLPDGLYKVQGGLRLDDVGCGYMERKNGINREITKEEYEYLRSSECRAFRF